MTTDLQANVRGGCSVQRPVLPLGRIHKWWLREFERAKKSHGKYTLGVGGYQCTAYGRALSGLITRGYVKVEIAFGGDLGLLSLTDKGIQELERQNGGDERPANNSKR